MQLSLLQHLPPLTTRGQTAEGGEISFQGQAALCSATGAQPTVGHPNANTEPGLQEKAGWPSRLPPQALATG